MSAALSRAPERRDRRARALRTSVIVLAVLATLAAAIARSTYRDAPFEPSSPAPTGTRAVTTVLQESGADVRTVRTTREALADLAAGRTVVLTDPDMLSPAQLRRLASAEGKGNLVLIAPQDEVLSALVPGVRVAGEAPSDGPALTADPQCGAASFKARSVRAGTFTPTGSETSYPGWLYTTSAGDDACFRTATGDGSGASIVRRGSVTVLGSPRYVMNGGIGGADDAAVAMNGIGGGGHGAVTWYLPSVGDPLANEDPSPTAFLPAWTLAVLGWTLLCVLLLLLALGRRLGPVVVEPLPVTVRSLELTVGRANLLQRARAHDAAARSLRSAAAVRLADRLGVRREESLEVLLAALQPHVSPDAARLRELLGPTPVRSEAELVRLARDLDRLEKEIER